MSKPKPTESIASTAIVLDWTFTGLAMLVVGLRFYTRTRLITALGLDDFIILTSVVCVARPNSLRFGIICTNSDLWYGSV